MMNKTFGCSAAMSVSRPALSITRRTSPPTHRIVAHLLPREGTKKHEKTFCVFSCFLWLNKEMPLEGVEPPPSYEDMDLNHARLPIPPQRLGPEIVTARH